MPEEQHQKQPLTWSEFRAEYSDVMGCKCGDPTCCVNLPLRCPHCGGVLVLAIHNNAPTLILGCMPCNVSVLYLKLAP